MLEAINAFDLSVLCAIGSTRNTVLDAVMTFISASGNKGFIFILVTVLLLLSVKTRKIGVYAAVSLSIDAVLCNVIIKPLVARPRPFDFFDVITRDMLIIPPPTDFSFPSGHTAAAFAFSAAIYYKNKVLGIIAFVFSVAMGYSRLYLCVHYPTDVLAGAILGIVCGVFSVLICNAVYKYNGDKLTNSR